MNIRSSTLLRIAITCIVLVALQYVVSSTIIRSSFESMSEQTARRNMERARFALDDLLQRLDYFVLDWASWDDTYRFVIDRNDGYRSSNLPDTSFTDQDINLAAFVNMSGEPVWGNAFDPDGRRDPGLLDDVRPLLRPGGRFFDPARTGRGVTGWVNTGRGLLLASSRPILPSAEDGPPRGVLLMGRLLDDATMQEVSRRTRLAVSLLPPDGSDPRGPSLEAIKAIDAGSGPHMRTTDKDTLAVFDTLRDVNGRPAALLRVDMPRDLEQRGDEVVRYNAMSVILAGMIFGVGIMLLLERRVMSRIESLSGQVQAVGASRDFTGRVILEGGDELGSLSAQINTMLAELERSRTELAGQVSEVQDSRQFLQSLLNSVQAGIVLIDPATHRIEEVNDFALHMTGQKRENAMGMICHGLLCPAEKGRCPVTDLRQTVDLSLREVVCADGGKLPVIKSVTTVTRHGRELLLETFIDISDIQRAQEALRVSEETYRTVFSAAGTAMAIADADGTIRLANSEFEALTGMPRILLEGNARWMDVIHPEDCETLTGNHDDDRCVLRERLECRVMAADGGVRHVILSMARIPGAGRVVLSMLDITGRKDAERDLRRAHDMLEAKVAERTRDLQEANERLLELDHLKSTFLNSASHELRTPLTSVLGFAKLMDKTFRKDFLPLVPEDPQLQRKASHFAHNLEIIRMEGERLTRLINDLLDLNKIESGRIEWRDEPLDVNELLAHVLQAMAGEINAKPGLTVSIEAAPGLPQVLADRDRINQVLVNLMGNAVKFTDAGGVTVTALPAKDGSLVEVRVKDTGPGLASDELDLVFDRFYQSPGDGEDRAKPVGTGLGLAICRQIVDHYGGDIWAESEPGRGSTFIFRLPALRGRDADRS